VRALVATSAWPTAGVATRPTSSRLLLEHLRPRRLCGGRHAAWPALTWLDSRGARHVPARDGRFRACRASRRDLLRGSEDRRRPTLRARTTSRTLFWRESGRRLRAARWLLGSKDWLNLRLTGRAVGTFDSVSLFWATDNRDIHRVRWDDKLLARLRIDPAKLPPLLRATDVLAPSAGVADALGVAGADAGRRGSPDLPSPASGRARSALRRPRLLGTSGWPVPTSRSRSDPLHSVPRCRRPRAEYYCATEQDSRAGPRLLLRNVLYRPTPCARPPRPGVLASWSDDAAVPPGANGSPVPPWLNGEKTPGRHERLRGGFPTRLRCPTTREDLVAPVYEGVAN